MVATVNQPRSVTVSERAYRGWRAAALTCAMLNIGLFVAFLVVGGFITKTESPSNNTVVIRSSLRREPVVPNQAHDRRLLSQLIDQCRSVQKLANRAKFTASDASIRKLADKMQLQLGNDATKLQSLYRTVQ